MIPFKQRLNYWPIQKKLFYSNMIAIAAAFIPVVIVLMVYEYYALRSAVLDEIRVQADIVGESSAAAMAFGDEGSALETLSALHGAQDLIEAHLVLKNGTVLKSYYVDRRDRKKKIEHFNVSKVHQEHLTINDITIEKPIFLRSEFVGSLILKSSLNSFYDRMGWFALIVLMTASAGYFLARLVAIRISRTITDPLLDLIAATQKVTDEKDYSTPVKVDSHDEVGNLSRAFGEMMSQIRKRDLTMQQLAYYDRVTGIANRHYFEERIEQSVGNALRYGTTCYLMIIDLDDFKGVNDQLGHHVGDLLLRHISECITSTMRQNDSLFRIGGDEFAVLIESTSDCESVDRIAQKIIQSISTPLLIEAHEVKVGASIGISCFPQHAHDVRTLMSTADSAMYAAKRDGKNTIRMYGDSQTLL
ncbi:sensor domain-containing diguanylate cyclase [Sulfuricurvum sp.]|uniref:sensor domain-containing diguanylate cyclase n=1 Tax=Sulfuricurvum sp. TaxID=2025608 RepID=UPI0026022EEF|nr:sensor domain-containing diguanylate cyclase [Sulfuricurvum sp.]MDD2838574.1 diguanylate cyclase [Sulfuricurvum sp.]MDD3597523.1 diguanylate cyclase [Sulfuricurvum sp.]